MRVCIDTDKCAGLGMCESWAPDLFAVADDGKVHLLLDAIDDERRAAVQGAVDNCPTEALSIVED